MYFFAIVKSQYSWLLHKVYSQTSAEIYKKQYNY